jgi:hypothetical protein
MVDFDESYDLPSMKAANNTRKLKDNLGLVINNNFV